MILSSPPPLILPRQEGGKFLENWMPRSSAAVSFNLKSISLYHILLPFKEYLGWVGSEVLKILKKFWEPKERRKYIRAPSSSFVKFRILDSKNPAICSRVVQGKVFDISLEGHLYWDEHSSDRWFACLPSVLSISK